MSLRDRNGLSQQCRPRSTMKKLYELLMCYSADGANRGTTVLRHIHSITPERRNMSFFHFSTLDLTGDPHWCSKATFTS